MKKVVSKETVAHMWANQTQDEARTPTGNMYFNGAAIWSYGSHFCIAKHVINDKRERAVLFTTRSYSVTTSAQKSVVRSASSHLNLIYCAYPNDSHEKNIYEWIKQCENAMTESIRAKQKRTQIKALAAIPSIKIEAEAYCNFFDIDVEKSYPVLFNAFKIGNTDEIQLYESGKRKAAEKQAAARLKEERKKIAKEVTKFRNDETDYVYNSTYSYLRFNAISNRIETSQRVEVPLRTAKSFYAQTLKVIKTGKCDICDTNFMNDYRIISIDKNLIVVGCHKIEFKEIQKLAKQLGW